jgi:hypothetical protein
VQIGAVGRAQQQISTQKKQDEADNGFVFFKKLFQLKQYGFSKFIINRQGTMAACFPNKNKGFVFGDSSGFKILLRK